MLVQFTAILNKRVVSEEPEEKHESRGKYHSLVAHIKPKIEDADHYYVGDRTNDDSD